MRSAEGVYQLYIDGGWVGNHSGESFVVYDPSTEEEMARVLSAGPLEVDRAVQAARRAFDSGPWPQKTPLDRAQILFRLATKVREQLASLAEVEATNSGKPIVEAEGDIAAVAEVFEYYAGLATRIPGQVNPVSANALSLSLREPVGVAGLIVPWNYPLRMAAWKLGLLNTAAGGWQMGGVVVLQSGSFLTPYQTTTDPAGTNMLSNVGATRADVVPNAPAYMHRTSTAGGDPVYLNSSAFADPANNSGGFGNAGVGNFVGPGTETVSLSLIKKTALTESTALYFGAEASNLFNHRNYDVPDLNVDDGPGAFGVITALQTAEGAGPRNIELTARITFDSR
jgi:hypothetical protein